MLEQISTIFENLSTPAKVGIVLGITLLVSLTTRMLTARLKQRSSGTKTPWDDALAHSLGAPLRLLIWVIGIGLALELSEIGKDTPFESRIIAIRDVVAIIAIAWFVIRFINNAITNLKLVASKSGKEFDVAAADGIGKLLRLSVFVVASLMAMQTLGVSIAGLLTFGGIGGIAVGFAAQDLLANFFGGLMIYLDKPFKIGDWIRSPEKEIEGVVEEIGWRMTVIRNFDSRPLYVPNSSFSSISIENVSRMTNRRIYETIGIRYDDSTAVDRIVSQTREYLENNPDIDQEQTLMVSFDTFAPSSLDFFIYCFTKTRSGPEYWRVKQEVMLHILGIIEDNGAECAFPTTTIHMQGPASMDSNAQQATGSNPPKEN